MHLLTNFERFPETWRSSSGVTGTAMRVNTVGDILRNSRHADFVIVNCDTGITLKLAAAYLLLPFLRRPVLSNDIVLRRPATWRARLTAHFKRFLFKRIDHYTVHFHDLEGYRKYFGIGPERASYLPFKANIRYRHEYKVSPDGDYILCFGRSERDYDSFFEAMATLPYPAAIPKPDLEALRIHGSRFTWSLNSLPPNVQILPDQGTDEALLRIIEKARLVVLPILGSRISPSGIGTYLNAMLMGKCVILTEGPAASDVFTNEVILVPPENPAALAAAIKRAWENDDLRRQTAELGRVYAEACGGEPELRQRVLDRALEVLPLR